MIDGKISDLVCLLIQDVGEMFKLSVDGLFVAQIDKWYQVEDRGTDKSKTPERNDFDKEVGQERGKESLSALGKVHPDSEKRKSYRNGISHILGKQKSLRFNDEKIEELMKIIHDTINRFLLQSVVSTRTDLGGEAIAKDKFTNNLGSGGYFDVSVNLSDR